MIEADAPSTEVVVSVSCARPTGGSHGLTTDDPVQHGEGAKRKAALQEDGGGAAS
jgi:hypothetical protein